jgi:hypothetical protein
MKSCAYCGRVNQDNVARCTECGTADFVQPEAEAAPLPEPQAQTAEPVDPDSDVAEDYEAELCTVCLFRNRPDSQWCKRCQAPMSSLVAFILPDAAYAFGSVFRRAIEAPSSGIIILGVWAYLLPGLLANAAALLFLLLHEINDLMTLWYFVALLLMISFWATILFRASRRYLAIARSHPKVDDSQ